MTNGEKYREELLEKAEEGNFPAVTLDGKISDCARCDCSSCLLNGLGDGCVSSLIKWLYEEYKVPVELHQFTVDFLNKILKAGYRWVARDEMGNGMTLNFYDSEPKKTRNVWATRGTYFNAMEFLFEDDFQFIKWNDEEPYDIAELLRNIIIKEKGDNK